ncbi:hypothetical protein QIS99_30375 [Streptomyces sp. B-S-A8]|uniref:Uncharacterized protein n=1 Tax=Streptomyces solicavernae TaxID=3043614 RepID=A0ABT6S197_9ACTN|nr:hypothetical protein [Streptomyces sp. B-S-A8]MDI3390467.1 hypothetical protein [Streptomyces sp. B-S-A8]
MSSQEYKQLHDTPYESWPAHDLEVLLDLIAYEQAHPALALPAGGAR